MRPMSDPVLDDRVLRELMDEAASAQDEVRSRSLDGDLAAGHRRLRRNRIVGGAGTLVVAAAVGAVVVSTTTWAGPDAATPAPPAAATSGATTVQRPLESGPPPTWTPGKPLPNTGNQQSRVMLRVLADHIDPDNQHLRVVGGEFGRVDGLGGARTTGGRVAYRIAGQPGEGYVSLGLAESTSVVQPCGHNEEHPVTCHQVRLSNGRTALYGRSADYSTAYYVRPDGEVATASVVPLFGNNTTIPLHDIPISQAQLLALVQDPRLTLPPLTQQQRDEKAQLTGYKPSRAELGLAARRHLTGGTLREVHFENATEDVGLVLDWKGAGIKQDLFLAVYAGVAGQPPCLTSMWMTAKCAQETLPDGRVVVYGEGAERFPSTKPSGMILGQGQHWPPPARYHKAALYRQPDGNWVSVDVTTVPSDAGKGLSKQQLIDLVTDPTLDK
jgi:hypothetical protein